MRKVGPRTIGPIVAFALSVAMAGVAAADNPTGAPGNTDAGQNNAALAQALGGLGPLASQAAQFQLIDDFSLACAGLTPPGNTPVTPCPVP
jgi:hypothetical protein